MKRVGILTFYKNSKNYGGILQSYALCKALEKIGFEAEQINYAYDSKKNEKTFFKKIIFTFKYKQIFETVISNFKKFRKKIQKLTIKNKITDEYFLKNIELRNKAFEYFEINKVPHSNYEYSISDLDKSLEIYDAFITGSDQVWNLDWYFSPFFLDFVQSNKIKISYAASLGKNKLNRKQINLFKISLRGFNAISVREEDSVQLIQQTTPVSIQWVLDPTLLLSINDWDEICSSRIVGEEYLFCYFLGNNVNQRNIAKKYAKKNNLKIVAIPHISSVYNKCDSEFADIELYDIGPEKWISLIKYARFIMTDSFHACVFSGIYEKQYAVFQRSGHAMMGSRIHSLLSIYETQERFCDCMDKESLQYITSLNDIDYTRKLIKLENKIVESIGFLENNLKGGNVE